ncbi:helix-turn-helix domain-containing protein [Halopseudomonas pachastrellae]|nr:helix-turn-helix domain-containing protein [Halopseudomonas pachastrellae]
MAQSDTVKRILDAAEQLFAEKGFAETSLRLITSKAGVIWLQSITTLVPKRRLSRRSCALP